MGSYEPIWRSSGQFLLDVISHLRVAFERATKNCQQSIWATVCVVGDGT